MQYSGGGGGGSLGVDHGGDGGSNGRWQQRSIFDHSVIYIVRIQNFFSLVTCLHTGVVTMGLELRALEAQGVVWILNKQLFITKCPLGEIIISIPHVILF